MKLLATLYTDYVGIAKLLEGLKHANIGCETRTVTEESGLAAVEILVDELHYDAACKVVEASPNLTGETGRPGYATLGRFEVPDARRIINRLNEEHIPFEIDAPLEVRPVSTSYRHPHWLYLYVRDEFKKRADEILLEGFQL